MKKLIISFMVLMCSAAGVNAATVNELGPDPILIIDPTPIAIDPDPILTIDPVPVDLGLFPIIQIEAIAITNNFWVWALNGVINPNSFYHVITINSPAVFSPIVSASTSEVPVPGAVWLFGSALVSLFGVKKRNNA